MKFSSLAFLLLVSGVLSAQAVDFSFQSSSGSFCVPVKVQFSYQSSDSPLGYVWDFGDGSNSNSANPAHTYSSAGTFRVKLIVIFAQSTASVTKMVDINPANSISLSADRSFICTPGNISFTASGPAQATYEWDYGDGSSESNTVGSVSHSFNDFKNYTATVKATNSEGCEASASVSVALKKPEISASLSPLRGCVPVTSNFTASVKIPSGSNVTSYLWDFGDGTNSTTSTGSISHSYSARGQYLPKLSITTSEGCTADYDFSRAAFGIPPTAIVAYPKKDTVCASENPDLIATALNANQYIWQFGDGTSKSVSDTITSHKYQVLGSQNVTVVPYDNGCAGSSATFPIEITGVIASYDFNINCSQRDKVFFTDYSLGPVTSFMWDYGDGQQNDSVISSIHIYPPNGSFNSVLTVNDSISGCSDIFQREIHTAVPTFTNADTVICRNTPTVFKVNNSYNNPATIYTYHIAGTVTAPVQYDYMNIRPANFGTFDNYVVIDNGPHYCKDTAYMNHQLLVRGPVLDFLIDSAICFNDSVHIVNRSHPYLTNETIQDWNWFTSNGDTLNVSDPSPFRFSSVRTNSVKLIATDINGCIDSLTKPVITNSLPFLLVIPNADTLCATSTDTLIAFHNNPILWSSPEAINCNSCDTIQVSPNVSTYYAVEAKSSAGCFSRDTISLKVYPQFSALALNPVSYLCPGDTVSLRVSPPDMHITWSPVSGISNSSMYNPVASPDQSTQFTALLTDSAGCFSDSVTFDVHIKSPALADAGPDTTLSYYAPFSLHPSYSNNIIKYEWSPPGDLSCVFCGNPTGTATDSYTYIIKATSDSGCVVLDSINISIECNQANLLLPNAFTPNNDGLNDIFYPIGHGISHIKRFAIYDRWGKLVFLKKDFRANDRNSGWDGRINGEPAAPDVFVYMVEATCGQGAQILKKGTVTLLK